ncbi:MAG: purine-nucleoside phosphorylase [Brevinemataceae bacterium]
MLYNEKLIQEAVSYLQSKGIDHVHMVVVLGSGLSHLAEQFESVVTVAYDGVPGMCACSVQGHAGKFIFIRSGGKNIVFMQGRMHMYEGHSAFESAFPVAVMGALGVKNIIVTNAAGGLDPAFSPGDIMMIEDHIKTQFASPLEGVVNNDRFVDMQNAYDISLYNELNQKFQIKKGVYVSTLGPQYETPAEVRFFQSMGGHAVGMSTVMETIMARYFKMRVFGFSMITNKAAGIPGAVLQHSDVVSQANKAGETLGEIISYIINTGV